MSTPTATGSRAIDRFVFLLLLAVFAVASYRVVVYDRVTPARVEVVAVTADGTRRDLPVPGPLAGIRSDADQTEGLVRSLSDSDAARRLVPPGGRVEWYVRYSYNSLEFDRVRLVGSTRR